MKIVTKTRKLTSDDLKLLSIKTGKSVKELKRLRKTTSYLVYNLISDSYSFNGYALYLAMHPHKSVKEFFKTIEQHELLKALQ